MRWQASLYIELTPGVKDEFKDALYAILFLPRRERSPPALR